MTIQNGVAVTSHYGYLGYNSGSTGTAVVDGAGSTWTASSDLLVGYSGNGVLKITNGGAVNSPFDVHVGQYGSGTVSVDGAGSTCTAGAVFCIGVDGKGTVKITGGGTVTSSGGCLGGSGSGTVSVDGAGSTWNAGSGVVSLCTDSGNGALSISGGAAVVAASGVFLGNSSALLAIDVGRGSSLTLGSGGIDNWGIVRLSAGVSVQQAMRTPQSQRPPG